MDKGPSDLDDVISVPGLGLVYTLAPSGSGTFLASPSSTANRVSINTFASETKQQIRPTAMATADAETDPVPQVVFRAKKKAKPYRQHTATTVENSESSLTANASEPAKEDVAPAATSALAASGNESTRDAPAAANSTAQDKKSRGEDEEEGLAVTELLKLRNARKHKLAGVGFRATDEKPSATGEEQNSMDGKGLIVRAAAGAAGSEVEQLIGGITKRFAPQTGLVGDLVNRHM